MSLTGAFDQLAAVREFSFRVQPERIGWLDVTKRHRHLSGRGVCDPRRAPHLSGCRPAAIALFVDFTHLAFFVFRFSLPAPGSVIRSVCDLPTEGFPSPVDTWPPCAARY